MVALADKPIRVCIAAAYPIMRNGLITTIEAEPQMHVVGRVAHHQDLIAQLRSASVDVLVINLIGIGDGPIAVIRGIRRAYPRLAIVVVGTVDFAPELLAAGVHGYISYEEPDEQLHLAIRAAKARQRFLSPMVQDYVDRCSMLTLKHRFVPRELQIIKCIAQGLDTEEIARMLDINFWTVRNYISSIRKKTGWTTWPQMVTWYHTMYGSETNGSSPYPIHA